MCTHSCPLNVIVRATFEWREMDNQLRSFGIAFTSQEGEEIYREAIALAHEDLAFSKRLTRLLCAVHSDTIADTAATTIESIEARTHSPIDAAIDVPLLWSLIVDRRPETSRLAWAWLRRSPGFISTSSEH